MSQRFAWYLAVLQLIFTLCWTVYVIYLPKLAAAAGIAQDLGQMVAAQLAAGAAWGAILMSAFTVAFAVGANGGEGRMAGLLFSALALATLTRMAAVATGFNADPALKAMLQWTPIVCWALAGAALLYLAFAGARRWAHS